jgi:hypothetical protein
MPRGSRKESFARRKEGIKRLVAPPERAHHRTMTDLLVLAILVAFFALTVVFVKACERVIGPDAEVARDEPERLAA